MNKARLQTQTGAGRLVTLTLNIQSTKSAWVTVDLLQISTICFISVFTYEWLTTQKGSLEVGEGMILCVPGFRVRSRGGGQNSACHSSVRHLFSQWGRRDNAGDSWWQRQLVVPLAPAYDPLWSDTSPLPWKEKRKAQKKPSLTNQNSRPDALPAPIRDQCHEDARLAH